MADALRDIIARNRAGRRAAIPSVCSAQPDVLRASLMRAQALDRPVVIEATSNQVNQDGGYTGITPDGFIGYVHDIADKAGVDRDRIIFGGDHLGPQAWRSLPADAAMEKARVLVRDYVKAGFRKIHLDCSEGCAGEAAQLDDAQTAARSADLARVCVEACDGDAIGLLFVVGTEVPPPGGARMDEDGDIPPTDPAAAKATLAAHGDSFGDMSSMIGGLVVQPGVEFSPTAVHHMPLDRDPGLLAALDGWPGVCLEAHSTDYQHPAVFPRLAELGFAFQKIGPALTFAYREALYALDQISSAPGALQTVMERVMTENPAYWQGHYHGDADALYHQRHFGLADRIRYYWPDPAAQAAVAVLRDGFDSPIPVAELRNVFSDAVLTRAEQLTGDQVQRLIDAQIQLALDPYFFDEAA
ncbi:class II D-tagatose-bisphosphate aldolase, non-catalytic subunit [Aliiroseovarius sp. S1339]|uniref:class II D-tagatose-bisphosphate aldolase non-catalytic subunit n=1 Tax=Aliiroseovarius sp. S1339 TaxID=2936990 RepID=UPI0020C068AC|nr:class II D-tagatose-bisphosphate aldolase, non-catalytic subunit [Aliiroseovarius sp. S1339]MCK8463759.1 class II D-tagatose-bisphosphate aldolase, non-catalytic subunit [Aliiroseovarius sp. S1339]